MATNLINFFDGIASLADNSKECQCNIKRTHSFPQLNVLSSPCHPYFLPASQRSGRLCNSSPKAMARAYKQDAAQHGTNMASRHKLTRNHVFLMGFYRINSYLLQLNTSGRKQSHYRRCKG